MNISIDAGGYCTDSTHKYGNYTFTENIVQALLRYDLKHTYHLYSFCKAPPHLQLKDDWRYNLLLPRKLWMKFRVSFEEMIHPKNIFLALNQAIPLFTRSKIISFSHGLSYYYFPQYYRESFIRLSLQLAPVIQKSSYIVVSSEKVRNEMKIVYPDYQNVQVIPFGIPFDMGMSKIITKKEPYFLYVGMNHPIKNIRSIIKAFKKFRRIKHHEKYHLLIIGALDLHSDTTEHIKVLPTVTRQELKKYYQNATAYLTASLYESFNFPVLEALSQGCPVIGCESAVIPEMKSYVRMINDSSELVEQMIEVIKHPVFNYSLEQLFDFFSWEHYVRRLQKLYSD